MLKNEIESWIEQIRTDMQPPAGVIDSKTRPFYELGPVLGHGGMGAVFLARLQPLGVLRALKVLYVPEQTSDAAAKRAEERFLSEARIMGNLRHPAAVKALDYQAYYLERNGIRAKRPSYLIYAMDPCLVHERELPRICADYKIPCPAALQEKLHEGQDGYGSLSLQSFLSAKCTFPEKTVARFARELISVLRSAHEQGIVHRDVKPANILIGSDGRLRLTDFGISKATSVQMSEENGFYLSGEGARTLSRGTEGYAAPEQWNSELRDEVSKEADYYSLGVVLYQLLTGNMPGVPWVEPSTFAKEEAPISRHWDILLRGMLECDHELRIANPDLLDYEFAEIEKGRG